MYRVVVTPAAMADIDYLEDWLLERDARYALDISATRSAPPWIGSSTIPSAPR